jgi:hypothetical protein
MVRRAHRRNSIRRLRLWATEAWFEIIGLARRRLGPVGDAYYKLAHSGVFEKRCGRDAQRPIPLCVAQVMLRVPTELADRRCRYVTIPDLPGQLAGGAFHLMASGSREGDDGQDVKG